MALTKADMAESLFNELGLNKREARELVDSFFEDLRFLLVGPAWWWVHWLKRMNISY